ncbi:10416_t:CDS:2 [Acaulospora morrowiae]|uniref:10416_t:CDS:1 n=1 Tax=Acaulospora morrowiae TaxID=94023 RepID=A0A9N8V6S0_9GLOM|nr:10416_t:CDS:2 [Acaulospora morrowiae]
MSKRRRLGKPAALAEKGANEPKMLTEKDLDYGDSRKRDYNVEDCPRKDKFSRGHGTSAELMDKITKPTYDEAPINEEGTDNPTDEPRELTNYKAPLTQETTQDPKIKYYLQEIKDQSEGMPSCDIMEGDQDEGICLEPQRKVVLMGDHFMAAPDNIKQDASNETSGYMLQHTSRKMEKYKPRNSYATTMTLNLSSAKDQFAPTDYYDQEGEHDPIQNGMEPGRTSIR